MPCAQCQHTNLPGAKFCAECGVRLAASCPRCGVPSLPAQKFCAECGTPLQQVDVARVAAADAYTPRHLAEKILASRAAVEGERKPVTVLFCDVVRSVGPGPRRSPLEARNERPLSHFVGRSRELGVLRALLLEVEAGRGQAVGIVGEPGVGKSRLLLELQHAPSGGAVRYLEGRCLSFGGPIPFLPILDVVRATFRLADADPPDVAIDKIRAGLADIGLDAAASMPCFLHLLGLKDASDAAANPTLAALSPEAIKARTFDTLRQLALRESRRQPLVIAIEDLHWIDRTSEEYLASLVDSLAGAAIMLVTTYRPGHRPAWLDKSYTTQLSVARLTSEDSLALVRSVLPDTALDDPRARRILDKAEGNPFFLEELARALCDAGSAASGLLVPDTVHGVLTARIDRLPESAKRVLQTASVLGREFSLRLLEAVWGGGGLASHLQELVRQEFLYERMAGDEPVYVFKHALTQDVAEATILGARRRELNALAARALTRLYPDRLAELAPRLAHHHLRAESWALACEHATRAAEAASAVHANREAVARYDEALSAGERAGLASSERMRLHAARGRAHGALGEFDAVRADLETALALGREAGDMRACAELLGALGELWGGHRDYHRGLELTDEAVRTAENAG